MQGPIGAEGVEALGARILHVLRLQLARGDVVEAGDAEHVVHRVGGLDVRGALADHHRHLGFVLDAAGPRRNPDLVVGTDHRALRLEEHQRLGGQLLVHLGRVILVVQADADDDRRHHRREKPMRRRRRAPARPIRSRRTVAACSQYNCPSRSIGVSSAHALLDSINAIHLIPRSLIPDRTVARFLPRGSIADSMFCGVARSTATTA